MKIYRFIRVALPVLIVLGFLFWLWWNDVASDKAYKLEALALITLLKDPPQYYPEINVAIGQIIPGETIKVLRMGYGKDFRAWLVMGSKKQEGWFIEDGKNVRVSKK